MASKLCKIEVCECVLLDGEEEQDGFVVVVQGLRVSLKACSDIGNENSWLQRFFKNKN